MEQTNLRETYLGVFKRLLSETLEELSVTPRPLTSTRSIGFADGEDVIFIGLEYKDDKLLIKTSFRQDKVINFVIVLFSDDDKWRVSSNQIVNGFMHYIRLHDISLVDRVFDTGSTGGILPVSPPLQESPEDFRATFWLSSSKGE